MPMRFRRKYGVMLPAVLTAGLVASGCTTTTPYAAKVGSQVISVAALNREASDLASNSAFVSTISQSVQVKGSGTNTYTTRFMDTVLGRRIALVLIQQALNKLRIGLSTSSPIAILTAEQSYGGPQAFAAFSKSYQRQLIADTADITALEAYLTKTNISIPALRSFYSAHPEQFTQICSYHILSSTLSASQKIYAQLQAGANFAQLAKAQSADSASAQAGGYLGCGTYAQYQNAFGTAFANTVASAPLNKPQPPVAEKSGYGVAMAGSRSLIPFQQAIPSVVATLFGSAGSTAVGSFVSGLAKAANIRVNPAYGSYKISGTTAQVVPPPTPAP